MKKAINDTSNFAVGPYSLAVESNGLVFCSGQIAINKDKVLVGETFEEQFKQAMINVNNVLSLAGCSLNDVVKVTLFLADINDFAKVNELYVQYFEQPFPARSTFQVGALPMGAKVEIEVIASKS